MIRRLTNHVSRYPVHAGLVCAAVTAVRVLFVAGALNSAEAATVTGVHVGVNAACTTATVTVSFVGPGCDAANVSLAWSCAGCTGVGPNQGPHVIGAFCPGHTHNANITGGGPGTTVTATVSGSGGGTDTATCGGGAVGPGGQQRRPSQAEIRARNRPWWRQGNPLPPGLELDDPNADLRVWGGMNDQYLGNGGGILTQMVVYEHPYGYQFYHREGFALGLVDFNTVAIPGPLGLVASFQTGNGEYRVDVYYLHDDKMQANLYQNGALIEEAWFDVAGAGARSTGNPGMPVPPLPGQGVADAQQPADGGGGGGVAPDGTVVAEVLCAQNLRGGASTDNMIMSVMQPGNQVRVTGRTNDGSWLSVETSNGLSGWAFNGRCLNIGAEAYQAPVEIVFNNQPTVNNEGVVVQQPTTPTDAVPAGASAAATVDGVSPVVSVICNQNLRTGPGTSYARDRVLVPGDVLNVIGRSSDASWLQVSGVGTTGWVYFGQCVLPQNGDITAAPVTVAFGGG
jgi:uncharacterized protein YraI